MKNIFNNFSHLFDEIHAGTAPSLTYSGLLEYFQNFGLVLDEEFADLYLTRNGLGFNEDKYLCVKLPDISEKEKLMFPYLELENVWRLGCFFMIDPDKSFQEGYINPLYDPGNDNFTTNIPNNPNWQKKYLVFGNTTQPSHLIIGVSPENAGKIYHWPIGGFSEDDKPYFAYNSLSEMLSAVYED
jgi:hypothetical protein